MFNTIFPRFSALVAAGDDRNLLEMYHGSTQVMAVMLLPTAIVISLFSKEIMLLWTGNPEIAEDVAFWREAQLQSPEHLADTLEARRESGGRAHEADAVRPATGKRRRRRRSGDAQPAAVPE